ncbi:MAG TPA: hypothetical protein VIG37_31030 [Methylomirabilota bacterium]
MRGHIARKGKRWYPVVSLSEIDPETGKPKRKVKWHPGHDLKQAGVHPKIVSERLGHSSISITLDTYSHAVPVLEESAAELVASLIYEAA